MKKNNYDLVIAGGGPGGVTSAITFKKLNPKSQILIFDTHSFPKYKIGEVILPGAFNILKRIGLLDPLINHGFLRKMGVYYYWGKSKEKGFLLPSSRLEEKNGIFTDMTPDNYSFHVERYEYDNILIKEAIKLGIQFISNANISKVLFKNDDNIDYLILNNKKIKAKFFIDSTGINKGIISNSIKQFKEKDFSGDICYHGYIEGADFLHTFKGLEKRVATTVGSYGNKCWFWYIPITEKIISVGIVFKSSFNKDFLNINDNEKEKLVLDVLSSATKIKGAIKAVQFINYKGLNKINILKNWNGISNKLYGKNWILVGDSAFFSDPILSAGVTMAHKTGFYTGVLLNEYLKSNSNSYKKLLLKTYSLYCKDFYSQVSDIIKFWYDGMDDKKDINDLFDKGKETMKRFGIVDNVSSRSTFLYVVNGLFESINTGGEYITLYEQDDYETIIKGLTGINISLNVSKIGGGDIYTFVNDFNISKRLKLNGFHFILTKYIHIKNIYNSSFFINDFISDVFDNINGKKTLNEITEILKLKYPKLNLKDFHKIIKKFIILDLIQCV